MSRRVKNKDLTEGLARLDGSSSWFLMATIEQMDDIGQTVVLYNPESPIGDQPQIDVEKVTGRDLKDMVPISHQAR